MRPFVEVLMTVHDDEQAKRTERAREVGLFRYALVRAAADPALSPRQRGALVREVAARTRLLATVGTFEFLRRSGRVTKLQAYAATMLDIKPVFEFRNGDAVPIARTRTRRRALAQIVGDTLREAGTSSLHLAVIHAAAEQEARDLLDRIVASANVVERLVTEVTPVIGAHTGPGLVGTAFYRE